MAAIKDMPKAARILDFVAGPESGDNYNAYFGKAGSTKDLSKMSVAEVINWMGNRGTASSATGRYQFMKATLKGLVTRLGVDAETAKFTPELQDRLAVQLLKDRGYDQWAAGKMTDAQFANKLALEWASLPNFTPQKGRGAGQSAYAGDGLNKSLVTPKSVQLALNEAKGLPATATDASPEPAKPAPAKSTQQVTGKAGGNTIKAEPGGGAEAAGAVKVSLKPKEPDPEPVKKPDPSVKRGA